jgi:hypothetical protein
MLKKILIILMLLAAAASGQQSRRLVELHATLGTMVSADENARYHLFGNLPDLHAIKFYQEQDGDYQLRIMIGNRLIIERLSQDEGRRVCDRIRWRFENAPAATEPAYVLHLEEEPAAKPVKLVLEDENTLDGEILSVTADTLNFRTPGGILMAIPEATIREVLRSRVEVSGGKFYRRDPNETRLFCAPTGRGLRRRQGYFADYWIFFPTVAVGVTDFLALSGGMSILPGASSQLFYVAPKLSLSVKDDFFIAGGFLHMGIPEANDFTLAYGVATLGNSRAALTGGFGVPVTDERDEMIFLIGGELQTSNSTKLITENWIPSSGDAVLSLGVRFFGERIAVDLAFITAASILDDANGWPFIPWVDFAVNFGN